MAYNNVLPSITLLLIIQWYMGVYKEMFNVNKIAQTMQNS